MAELLFFAVPSNAYKELAKLVSSIIKPEVPIVSTAKGFGDQLLLPSQVLSEQMPDNPNCTMSGPNIAAEMADGEITATVVAGPDKSIRRIVREVLSTDSMRVYENSDQYGIELSGALKNIYAIISGITEAVGAGQNTKSLSLIHI